MALCSYCNKSCGRVGGDRSPCDLVHKCKCGATHVPTLLIDQVHRDEAGIDHTPHGCRPYSAANAKQVGGSHYKGDPIQHWDLVVANEIPYLDAVAIKYVMRHAKKNGREDLEKAKHYIDKMIEVYYPEKKEEKKP